MRYIGWRMLSREGVVQSPEGCSLAGSFAARPKCEPGWAAIDVNPDSPIEDAVRRKHCQRIVIHQISYVQRACEKGQRTKSESVQSMLGVLGCRVRAGGRV